MPSAVVMFYPVFMPLNEKTANILCPIRAVKQWKVDLWEISYSQSTFCLLTPEIRGEKPRQLHSTTLNTTRVLFFVLVSVFLNTAIQYSIHREHLWMHLHPLAVSPDLVFWQGSQFNDFRKSRSQVNQHKYTGFNLQKYRRSWFQVILYFGNKWYLWIKPCSPALF